MSYVFPYSTLRLHFFQLTIHVWPPMCVGTFCLYPYWIEGYYATIRDRRVVHISPTIHSLCSLHFRCYSRVQYHANAMQCHAKATVVAFITFLHDARGPARHSFQAATTIASQHCIASHLLIIALVPSYNVPSTHPQFIRGIDATQQEQSQGGSCCYSTCCSNYQCC
jgi:hypothetical protein